MWLVVGDETYNLDHVDIIAVREIYEDSGTGIGAVLVLLWEDDEETIIFSHSVGSKAKQVYNYIMEKLFTKTNIIYLNDIIQKVKE